MKKQLYFAIFALVFCAVNVAQASCMGGSCAKKERTARVKNGCSRGSCSTGTCGK